MPLNPDSACFVPKCEFAFLPVHRQEGTTCASDLELEEVTQDEDTFEAEAAELSSRETRKQQVSSPVNIPCAQPRGRPSSFTRCLPEPTLIDRPQLALLRVDSGIELTELDFDEILFADPPAARAKSLSPRARFFGEDDGSRPELLWASCYDSPAQVKSVGDCLLKSGGISEKAKTEKSEGSSEKKVNKVTVDDFEILHMIGEGGFGKVYQVRKHDSGKVFAMKCMRKEVVLKDNLRGTKAERSVMSRLRHPYIVTMHFAFQCKGRLYLIMDYFPGGQFLDLLHKNAPFSLEACQIYTAEVTLALEELHANGIVHRDLKPENILVDAAGHLVVTDFGCSKVHEDGDCSSPIRAQSWAGTELYMAPEQLKKDEYGQEVDWWALGVLAWEMVTGDHPFYHDNRKVIYNNILRKKLVLPAWHKKEVHAFLKGLLSRDPSKRLGASMGAKEVKEHGFFKGLNFDAILRKEVAAPLRSHALSGDDLDVSAHSKRYTSAKAELSPLLSPMLSTSGQEHFSGFSFYGEAWNNDSFALPAAAVRMEKRIETEAVNSNLAFSPSSLPTATVF